MNDPNGPYFAGGGWVIFYQRSDVAPSYTDIGWGRATSSDLLLWNDEAMANAPNEAGYVYSGCTLDEPGTSRRLAFFTRHHAATQHQTQERAVSTDGGRHWTPDPPGTLIDEGSTSFRDPFVVRDGATGWTMLIARPIAWDDTSGSRSTLAVYRSTDLLDWQTNATLDLGAVPGEIYECPCLVRLPVAARPGRLHWVLVVSIIDRRDGRADCSVRYWTGALDNGVFVPDAPPRRVDHGPDFYAATPFEGLPDGEAVIIAWMNSWAYARRTSADVPTGGTQCLPRRLSLAACPDNALRLIQHIAADPARLGAAPIRFAALEIDSVARDLPLRATAYRLDLAIDFRSASAVELGLRCGPQDSTIVEIDRHERTVTLTRTHSDIVDAAAFAGRWSCPTGDADMVCLSIMVDTCSIEIFADGGAATLTATIYPPAGHDRITLAGVGGTASGEIEMTVIAP